MAHKLQWCNTPNCLVSQFIVLPDGDKCCPGCGKLGSNYFKAL